LIAVLFQNINQAENFSIPILAKIEVKAANTDERTANNSHIKHPPNLNNNKGTVKDSA